MYLFRIKKKVVANIDTKVFEQYYDILAENEVVVVFFKLKGFTLKLRFAALVFSCLLLQKKA